MLKKIIISGLLGFLVLITWNIVVNGLLGFEARMLMKQVDEERVVYEVLKEHIKEPGRYTCNPALTADYLFPEGEAVFGILYGGVGHEAAGRLTLIEFLIFMIAPTIAAWLLSQASEKVLVSFGRKVLFFAGIGLLIAVFSDLPNYGIGNYPLNDVILLALNNIVVWTMIGLVVAWRLKPVKAAV